MGERPIDIQLCVPEMFGGYGGIQTYMRLLGRALVVQGRLDGITSLKDERDDVPGNGWLEGHSFESAGGSKSRFAGLLARNRHSSRHLLFGHINQAPLGPLLSWLGRVDGYGIILHGVESWERLSLSKRFALDHADFIVSTTRFTRELVERVNDISPNSHAILPLAVEPGRFPDVSDTASPRELSAGDSLRILTVARLDADEQYKGVDHTLEALARRRDAGQRVEYVIVGDGSDRNRLEQLAGSLGVSPHVDFLGRVSDERLNRAFVESDIFSMPSAGEGFGLVYLEAMHHGLPVIGAPEGGAQHVLDHERNALMVEYGAVDQIAEALDRLTTLELRKRLSVGARQAVAEEYSFEHFNRRLSQILEQI